MKNRTFFLALITTLALGVAYTNFFGNSAMIKSQPQYVWNVGETRKATPQIVRDRAWAEQRTKEVFTLGDESAGILYGPLNLKVDGRDHLFVADYGEMLIKEFSSEGALLSRYGRGRGQGPGEFNTINDFVFAPDGNLWVADDSNGRISIFSLDGSFLRAIKAEHPPYRIVTHGDGTFTMILLLGSEHLFGLFDKAGSYVRTFGRFLEDQERNPLVLDGWIESIGTNEFIYLGHYASLIARYGSTGELKFLVETIRPLPLPKLVRSADGDRTWVDREARGSSWGLNVTSKGIHAISAVSSGLKRRGVIDTYNLEDGLYSHSLWLPEPCLKAVVTERHVYTVKESSITKWALVKDESALHRDG